MGIGPPTLLSACLDAEERIVVTKDRGFLDEHLLNGSPERVLLVNTGNIHYSELLDLVVRVEPLLSRAFEGAKLVELNRDAVVID
jgi:predicted nuclease of predicted toxin-antitoxin system